MYVHAAVGGADLSAVQQASLQDAGDGRVQRRVVEDDGRILAAEFERDALEVASRGTHDRAAHIGRTRERHLVDGRVFCNRGADVRATGHDVDDAVGHARLGDELSQAQGGQRRLLGRLDHAGVAARQRGRELPCRDHQREVPRNDQSADTDGLAHGVVERAGERERVGVAGDLRDPARVVAEVLGGGRDAHLAGDADRLALVARLELGELVGVAVDEIADAPQQPGPLGGQQ